MPADIRHAARYLVGHYLLNKEPVVTGTIATAVPETVDALLSPYRVLIEDE